MNVEISRGGASLSRAHPLKPESCPVFGPRWDLYLYLLISPIPRIGYLDVCTRKGLLPIYRKGIGDIFPVLRGGPRDFIHSILTRRPDPQKKPSYSSCYLSDDLLSMRREDHSRLGPDFFRMIWTKNLKAGPIQEGAEKENPPKEYSPSFEEVLLEEAFIEPESKPAEFLSQFLEDITGMRIFKDVSKDLILAVSKSFMGPLVIESRLEEQVVFLSLLWIDQYPIGLADLLKSLLLGLFSRIAIWMVQKGEPSVGTFDILRVSVLTEVQHSVIIFVSHCS